MDSKVLLLVLAVSLPAGAAADGPRIRYEAGKRATSDEVRRKHHAVGVAQAREALARDPADPEALLFFAGNLGGEALARGKLVALRAVPEIEAALLKLDAVAPTYEHAAASRGLARLYHKAPPIISVGSDAKARRWYERALSLAPDFPGNQALAADFFHGEGDRERARALAEQVLAAPMPPTADVAEWLEIARRIVGRR